MNANQNPPMNPTSAKDIPSQSYPKKDSLGKSPIDTENTAKNKMGLNTPINLPQSSTPLNPNKPTNPNTPKHPEANPTKTPALPQDPRKELNTSNSTSNNANQNYDPPSQRNPMPPKVSLQQQNFINTTATTSQNPQKKPDRAMQEERPIVIAPVIGNNWGEDEQ